MQVVKYTQLHFATQGLPMQFISVDLIGPFDPSVDSHHYALTLIYILCLLKDIDY